MGTGEGGCLSGRVGRGGGRTLGKSRAWSIHRVSVTAFTASVVAVSLLPLSSMGQEPPDSLQVPPDSLLADSLPALDSLAADSLAQDTLVADTLQVDSLPPPPVLPTLPNPVPAGTVSGIWEWDRSELLGVRGQTLWELLADIPGLLAVRSGDFGSAATVFPVGYSGGGLRLYYDGVEHLPLEGSIPDLSRVPLSGLERVRVVERPNGVEVHLYRLVHTDVRPLSVVEAGTGDLDTNLLRATFSMPRVFGGKGALAIERLDTQGRDAPGALTGGWFRYSLHKGDTGGVRFEIRRMGSERTVFTPSPPSVSRSDWTVQGNWTPSQGLLAEAWATGASVGSGDSLQVFTFSPDPRKQYGTRFSFARGVLWGRTTTRFNSGDGVADRELSGELSMVSSRWGGVSGRVWSESWDDRGGSGYDVRAWLSPVSLLSVFVERGDGSRSVPFLNPLQEMPDSTMDPMANPDPMTDPDSADAMPAPQSRFTHRTGTRYGARLRWRQVEFTGARVSVEADSVWPTQLLFDRGGLVLPQPRRLGWEVTGRVPVWPAGLFLVAHLQQWEQQDSVSLYFPDHTYRGSLSFHRVFRESGSAEVWVDLGAQGRSAMNVPLAMEAEPDPMEETEEDEEEVRLVPTPVPFYQNWYFRLQIRVLSLNIFATVENLSVRSNNQDVPGILLPRTRSMYGVRWTFWN